MKLELELNEVQFLLNVLGQLATSTGAYPLLVKLQAQVQEANTPVSAPAA